MRLSIWAMFLLVVGVLVGSAVLSAWAGDDTPAKETGTVIGKVIDSDNNVVKGGAVAIKPPKTQPTPKGQTPAKRPAVANGRSGDDGTFKIENVPVGTYVAAVHAQGKHPGDSKPFEVKANETVDAGIIIVKVRDDGGASTAPSK